MITIENLKKIAEIEKEIEQLELKIEELYTNDILPKMHTSINILYDEIKKRLFKNDFMIHEEVNESIFFASYLKLSIQVRKIEDNTKLEIRIPERLEEIITASVDIELIQYGYIAIDDDLYEPYSKLRERYDEKMALLIAYEKGDIVYQNKSKKIFDGIVEFFDNYFKK
ncbi:hypothetical protein [uncultured Rummeliibacillus sp.]|uniref:hypothetical protein n=1 Tax=uncultured Rummeliibacillus sp. TaxID=762292 RepID=UPI0026105176|nr:hypothetical protein [uncultured Rummeliibacillus sp.]